MQTLKANRSHVNAKLVETWSRENVDGIFFRIDKTKHPSFSDLSFWCYDCNSYAHPRYEVEGVDVSDDWPNVTKVGVPPSEPNFKLRSYQLAFEDDDNMQTPKTNCSHINAKFVETWSRENVDEKIGNVWDVMVLNPIENSVYTSKFGTIPPQNSRDV
ncbi:hypothetical protein Glove_216g192 [Diversispora epigaea]|uniref:Uncharacterized protein n=1 Tax=Diversispora epigaea TaxID=1348612 RepID=A0A397IK29_9GLOM|nr:hypothetical protein Glove_216g192 [Diversispora epigaea]